MITTGAISISKMMMVNHSLQELYIGGNSIGDDGISAIARALSNCKINKLNVDRCNITLIGATSLSAVLSSNHTIRNLWLEGNPITVEGALLIVKSAVDNTVCQYVHVDYEYYENYEVTKMMNILRDRGRQEVRDYVGSFKNLSHHHGYRTAVLVTASVKIICTCTVIVTVLVKITVVRIYHQKYYDYCNCVL